ncbi:50S ribosomal protein L28 [bacterium BMS3Bbin02]|nr:50S ribosomal protein L28 [bacterium BMS3Bbin02]
MEQKICNAVDARRSKLLHGSRTDTGDLVDGDPMKKREVTSGHEKIVGSLRDTAEDLTNQQRVTIPAARGGSPTMAYRCDVCGKEPWFGKQVSFSHKRSSRRWLPNIQRVRVKDGSNSKRLRVCTSCLKSGKVEKV